LFTEFFRAENAKSYTEVGTGLGLVIVITHFESTIGAIGGQPANFMDGAPVAGTGAYYYSDPSITGGRWTMGTMGTSIK